ncbi:hypothetical protein ACFX5E_11605 [Flavobacterium sp. LS2P90]|uniref:Uncharacterized protein n=1 Tax=Flavobacterium xylosi TaxID=3230415 RepID=A0ABW6HXI1_9FLAO
MRATKYFHTKEAMTQFACEFKALHPLNWYIRTTLECDHAVIQKRKAIVLVSDEKVIQRIIYCPICHKHGNAIVEPKNDRKDV